MNSLLGALNIALILAALLAFLHRQAESREQEPVPVEIEDRTERKRQVKR